MERYKILTKGVFEKVKKFEERLNSESMQGWRAISITTEHGQYVVLMRKEK